MPDDDCEWYGLVQDVDKRGRPKGRPYMMPMSEEQAKQCSAYE